MKLRSIVTLCALSLSLVPACTHDVVLPSPSNTDMCGDGLIDDPSEECDTQSPGCTACKTTPGWTCVQNTCFYPCGDGIAGDGAQCQNAYKTTACDMNGWWIARENDSVRDAVLGEPQPASTWYLYRISETNGVFQIEQAIHCGFHVTGSATVDVTPGTLKGLLYENDPSVNGPHGPRKGTFVESGNGCTFSFDRFYRVRGGVESLLPADFLEKLPLSALPQMPYEDDPLHPTGQHLEGQEDTDGDGIPGASYAITGITSGIRESTQRDFKEYASAPGEVPQNQIQFTVHGDWDLEEHVLSVNSCTSCSLIATPGHTDNATLPPRITFRYLGSSLDATTSPRVAAVVVRNPGEDVAADLETCANVRLAMPHDPNP